MAGQDRPRRQHTIEDRIEEEFRRASGGIPAFERMRQEYHAKYADNPSLQSFIDRVADTHAQALVGGRVGGTAVTYCARRGNRSAG